MKKRLLYIAILILLASGCARARHAVPVDLFNRAQIAGMQDIRFVSDKPSPVLQEDVINSSLQERNEDFPLDAQGLKTYPMLAISGGAANGAYGAGLLKGWSVSGTRPVFKIVTGVSAGAIIAPLAFLGSTYDSMLEEFFTTHATRDITRNRRFLSILFHDSLATSWPLAYQIRKNYTREILREIAKEYRKGRRLYIGTTDMDAQQFVLWDMGKIASNDSDEALHLFQKIILASASIPVAFPPVFFDVDINGTKYDEMHADGGVTKQVFFVFETLAGVRGIAREKGLGETTKFRFKMYIIRNGYIDSVWKEVPDTLMELAGRSMDTLINSQGLGDIYHLYTYTKMGQGDFNLAFIPATHKQKPKEMFDKKEMTSLFSLGYEQAKDGYPWMKIPPGLEEAERNAKKYNIPP